MQQSGWNPSSYGLEHHGITNLAHAWWNLTTAELYEHAIRRGEAQVAHQGPLVATTGQHTGRSPNDKFFVREASSENHIWWGKNNREFNQENFDRLLAKVLHYLQGKEL